MPSKRRSQRKPPAILRTPIEYSEFAEEQAISRQIDVRLRAVFDYFGVDRESPSGANELIELMARHCFPAGFRRVLKGTPKTKKPKWDYFRKNHLIEFFTARQDDGMSQEDAARLYIERYCPERSSRKGLVAEYNRAEQWSRTGKLTDLEHRQITELMREMRSDQRRGK